MMMMMMAPTSADWGLTMKRTIKTFFVCGFSTSVVMRQPSTGNGGSNKVT